MREKEVTFLNKEEKELSGFLRIPLTQEEETAGAEKKFPIAIICHDFNQNKDVGFMRDLFNIISYAGFLCLRFDFSGHGLSEGDFAYTTISKQRGDLTAALDFIFSFKEADTQTCLVIGHGTGASIALLEAASDKRITALGLIEPYFDFESHIKSYIGTFVHELKTKGEIYLENRKLLKKDYLDDIYKQDIEKAVERINIPIFIAHGTMDYRVPIHDVRMLYLKAKEPKTLELIDGADHDYTNTEHRNFLIELLTGWINRTLK